ncbi:MAG TPA: aquaporin [Phycisphaerales bacterium]|nr:aquaporin [Phycisphaerales bacterium]HMP36900.1 aquaporin [Phycisphaerales bacterium]
MSINKLIMEFVGTFFLVLTIGLTVLSPESGVIAPIAIGMVLATMIYAGGHISGAHYNPAVTIAVWLRGRCDRADVLPYIVTQVVAATAAALIVGMLRPGLPEAAPAALPVGTALVAEFLFTFALAFVVLSVATAKATQGNSYFGIAIGLVVLAGAFAVGDISGAAFNPAVAVGVSVMRLAAWNDLWIYLVAQFAGAAVAATLFKAIVPGDR